MSGTVLITGGFGYLGSRMAVGLLQRGYKVRVTTRGKDVPRPGWLTEDAEVVSLDLLPTATAGEQNASGGSYAQALHGVDAIVHLAAANEIESQADPLTALSVNTSGTLALLRAATQARVRRFIYFSTAHVYGAPLQGTLTENVLPRPNHPYAITHKAAEDFVLAEHDKKTIDGVVFRLSNGFGAPVHPEVKRWTLLANDLCKQAVLTKKLVLKSSGVQLRDFIPLQDVVNATAHILSLQAKDLQDGLFNLGGENAISIRTMAELVAARCQAVLGFLPGIEAPAPNPAEVVTPLEFRIDKLKSTGFKLNGSHAAELDDTLRLCQAAATQPMRLFARAPREISR